MSDRKFLYMDKDRTRLRDAIKKRRYRAIGKLKLSEKSKKARAIRMREYNRRPEVLEKQRIYRMVKAAIKSGALVKSPCECGATNVHAHHDDYSRPLDVRWLCPRCHAIAHGRSPRYGMPQYEHAIQ